MKKFLIYAITGALLLALVSSLITGFVTRNVVSGDSEDCDVCTTPVPPQPDPEKVCNEIGLYGNSHKAPEGFLWSAASASYQFEGDYEGAFSGTSRKGRGWTNWDYITHNIRVKDGDTGDDGSKFLEHLDEDIALFKSQGIGAYRFSLAWSRLIPSGYMNPTDDQFFVDKWFKTTYSNDSVTELASFTRCKEDNNDEDGTKYCMPWQVDIKGWNKAGEDMYRLIASKIKAAGMIPMVTLYHWDHPLEFSTWGAWRNKDMTDRFVEYATEVFSRMSDISDYWIIYNEPSVGACMVEHEIIQGMYPSAKDDPNLNTDKGFALDGKTFLSIRHHIVLATHRVFKIVQDLKAKKLISATLMAGNTMAMSPPRSERTTPDYLLALEMAENQRNLFDYHTAITGEYPKNQKELWNMFLGDTTTYDTIVTPADIATIKLGTTEFVGINFYAPAYIRPVPATTSWKLHEAYTPSFITPEEEFANGIIDPDALRDFLRNIKLQYGNIPTIITENGYGPKDATQQDVLLPDGSVDDKARCVYVARHIKGVLEAAADGVDVRAYTLWSSHDNLEWSAGYFVRFGSIYVDYDNGYTRYPKKSFYGYREIIKNNGTMKHDMCDTVDYKGQTTASD